DFEKSLRVLTTGGKVSAHYLVRDQPAEIYGLVDETRRAWQAGVSSWGGMTSLNSGSIGIEIVNPGFVDEPTGRRYFPYPQAQIDQVIALCKDIVARNHIKPEKVVGHSDIAPGRKQDPGPLFPWQQLAEAGIIPWPNADKVATKLAEYQAATELPGIAWYQEKLAKIGYGISKTGEYDVATKDALAAFQTRYRPSNFIGAPDAETAALLDVMTAPEGMLMWSGKPGEAPRPYTAHW
ncbi:MAG TPA: N-acetylmuramoyl-L-alanine amidase, partial [Burkholderiaceae bacterium]